MWAASCRRAFTSLPGRYLQENRDYMSKNQENLYLMLEKLHKDFVKVDFDNVPQLFTKTRQPHESLRYLRKVNRVAGVIKARDEFPEVNLTHKFADISSVRHKCLFRMGGVLPYDINIDEDESIVRCTVADIRTHDSIHSWFFWAYWDRFIEGRPNRVLMKIAVQDQKNVEGVFRGAHMRIFQHFLWCDVYSSPYPRVLACRAEDLVPGKYFTIGDLRRDLPDNVKLCRQYDRSDTMALIGCENNVKSGIYESFLAGSFDASRWYDVELSRLRVPEVEGGPAAQEKSKEKLLSSAETAHMQKVAKHLGKDFETLKAEILKAREKVKAKPEPPPVEQKK